MVVEHVVDDQREHLLGRHRHRNLEILIMEVFHKDMDRFLISRRLRTEAVLALGNDASEEAFGVSVHDYAPP